MAQYGVCRMIKIKRSACYGIALERNREKDDGRNYARSEIDKELTDCNIILHGKDCHDFNAEITRQIEAAGVKERPDSVALIGILFTASAEYFTPNPEYIELSEEEALAIKQGLQEDVRTKEQRQRYLYDDKAQQFFEDSYQFCIDDIFQGDASRVIHAKIDLDEKTPHLQIYGVPLHERTNKKGITKMHLSAKDIFGDRNALRARQDRFHEQICKPRGFERGEKVDWDIPLAERRKHEETHAHKQAERKALEASQTARIAANEEYIKEQEALAKRATERAEKAIAEDKKNVAKHNKNVAAFNEWAQEHNAILSTQKAQIAANDAELAEQAKTAQQVAESLQQQENELARGRIQLQKQAEAAEALAKSKIKKNGTMFHRDEELPYKMNMKDYQNATGQVAAVKRVLDDPVYTPQERADMQRQADAMRQSKQAYDKKAQELDDIVEQRVQDRLALLNRTEPEQIKRLEKQLNRARNDLDYVVDAVKMFLQDNGLSIKDFERDYGVKISGGQSRDDREI